MQLHDSDNYIQMFRNRVGLTQEDFAALLSREQRATVSRYESGGRRPDLEGLLAMEIIFGESLQTLFPGTTEKVRKNVSERAAELLADLSKRPKEKRAEMLSLLNDLANSDGHVVVPTWEDAA